MSVETDLQTASALVERWAKASDAPEANRLNVTVDASDLLAAIQALHESDWGYLATITGLDLGVEAGELAVLYHFCVGLAVFTLWVRIPRDAASIPSIHSIIPSVSFYERELSEMFGITVVGAPSSERLFLPDDWPAGVYPLRKDFDPQQLAL